MEIEWIGMIAGVLTTCAFVPQVVKTVRSRSTGDLSWLWLVMMAVGVFLWMLYGYFIDSPSVFVANIFTLFCLLALLYVKISVYRQTSDGVEYVIKKRRVGFCIGCGQCHKGCPLIIEYREKVSKENDREPLK
jgi:MtN3 and saliva related transmembrane protein